TSGFARIVPRLAKSRGNIETYPAKGYGAEQAKALWNIELLPHIGIARCPRWQSAFAQERKDHRYYGIVADTIDQGFEYGYFTLKDSCSEIRAIQPFFVNDQDLLTGTSPKIRAFAAFIRRFWPRFLRMRTLMIGCAAGEGHLDAADETSRLLAADS